MPSWPVRILEAGCGRKWPLDLKSIEHALTGLDIDEAALDIGKNITRDLDDIIYGDLRYADLGAGQFDVICSAYVLEHITPVVSRHGIRKFCEKLGRLKDNHADLMYILKKD